MKRRTMGEELAVVRDAFEKEVRDALEESMAKDTTTGPVSKPEGGHYESSEDIRMANEELPQTEVVREFDKELAATLVEGGYYSLFQIAHANDGLLMELDGVGFEELAVIREKAPYEALIPTIEAEIEVEVEVEEDEAVEDETPEEELPELADLVVGPVGATAPIAPVAPVSIGLPEILGDKIGDLLIGNGYSSPRAVTEASDAELLAIKGLGKATLKKIRELIVPLPASLAPASIVSGPPVSERVRRSMESAKSR